MSLDLWQGAGAEALQKDRVVVQARAYAGAQGSWGRHSLRWLRNCRCCGSINPDRLELNRCTHCLLDCRSVRLMDSARFVGIRRVSWSGRPTRTGSMAEFRWRGPTLPSVRRQSERGHRPASCGVSLWGASEKPKAPVKKPCRRWDVRFAATPLP